MTDRERLTALLMSGAGDCLGKGGALNCSRLADYLLEHGVIVAEEAEKHSLIKVEAVKEFAYRLRQRSYESSDWSHGEHPLVAEWSDIDEVLEEMAGDTE